MMSIVQRVQEFLRREHDHTNQQTPEPSRHSAQLYRCTDCRTTYIDETMDSCPQCKTPVETIPTERDLGLR